MSQHAAKTWRRRGLACEPGGWGARNMWVTQSGSRKVSPDAKGPLLSEQLKWILNALGSHWGALAWVWGHTEGEYEDRQCYMKVNLLLVCTVDWTEMRLEVGLVTILQCWVITMGMSRNIINPAQNIHCCKFLRLPFGETNRQSSPCLPRLINESVMKPLTSCLWFLLLIHKAGLSLSNTFWTWQHSKRSLNE